MVDVAAESILNAAASITNASAPVNYSALEIQEYLKQLDADQTYKYLPAIIFVGFLGTIGVLGNILVLVVYTKYFKHSTSRVFILALTSFDLMSNTLGVIGEIVDLEFTYTYSSSFFCRFFRFIVCFSAAASVSILVAISVERYYKICKPFGKQITEKMANKIIAVVVILTIIWAVPELIFNAVVSKPTDREGILGQDCAFNSNYKMTSNPKVFLALHVILYVSVAIVLIVLYSFIGMAIYRQKNRRMTLTNDVNKERAIDLNLREDVSTASVENGIDTKRSISSDQPNPDIPKTPTLNKKFRSVGSIPGSTLQDRVFLTQKSLTENTGTLKRQASTLVKKYKTTFMLLTLTIAFVISFFPFLILSILKLTVKDFVKNLSTSGYVVYTIFHRSFFLNAAVNCFIYSFWNNNFRDGVKTLFNINLEKSQEKKIAHGTLSS